MDKHTRDKLILALIGLGAVGAAAVLLSRQSKPQAVPISSLPISSSPSSSSPIMSPVSSLPISPVSSSPVSPVSSLPISSSPSSSSPASVVPSFNDVSLVDVCSGKYSNGDYVYVYHQSMTDLTGWFEITDAADIVGAASMYNVCGMPLSEFICRYHSDNNFYWRYVGYNINGQYAPPPSQAVSNPALYSCNPPTPTPTPTPSPSPTPTPTCPSGSRFDPYGICVLAGGHCVSNFVTTSNGPYCCCEYPFSISTSP